LAFIVRYPNIKTKMAPVFEGKQGIGKSTFFEWVLKSIIGYNHGRLISDSQSILGQFNLQLSGAIFVLLEEALFSGIKAQAVAKSLITARTQET